MSFVNYMKRAQYVSNLCVLIYRKRSANHSLKITDLTRYCLTLVIEPKYAASFVHINVFRNLVMLMDSSYLSDVSIAEVV
jgi:hypothetical protein